MKPLHALLASLLLTPVVLLWMQLSKPDADNETLRGTTGTALPAQTASKPPAVTLRPDDTKEDQRADSTQTSPAPQLNNNAIEQLRSSMSDGDPRAPAVAADQRQYQRADENVRATPQAYSAYQAAQQLQRRATYVYAAGKKLAEIDAQLEWGRENGVSDAQLAMAEEKRDRLARARERLLEENPGIPELDISPERLEQK